MKSAGAFVASTLAMLVAAPAFSCPPPPPMPPPPPPREGASPADQAAVGAAWLAAQKTLAVERSRQRTSDVQRDLFEGAGSVILARFDRIEETTGSPPRSVLAPVQWL
jgi:hypothetical protein